MYLKKLYHHLRYIKQLYIVDCQLQSHIGTLVLRPYANRTMLTKYLYGKDAYTDKNINLNRYIIYVT